MRRVMIGLVFLFIGLGLAAAIAGALGVFGS